jgi:hypothetical protein
VQPIAAAHPNPPPQMMPVPPFVVPQPSHLPRPHGVRESLQTGAAHVVPGWVPPYARPGAKRSTKGKDRSALATLGFIIFIFTPPLWAVALGLWVAYWIYRALRGLFDRLFGDAGMIALVVLGVSLIAIAAVTYPTAPRGSSYGWTPPVGTVLLDLLCGVLAIAILVGGIVNAIIHPGEKRPGVTVQPRSDHGPGRREYEAQLGGPIGEAEGAKRSVGRSRSAGGWHEIDYSDPFR